MSVIKLYCSLNKFKMGYLVTGFALQDFAGLLDKPGQRIPAVLHLLIHLFVHADFIRVCIDVDKNMKQCVINRYRTKNVFIYFTYPLQPVKVRTSVPIRAGCMLVKVKSDSLQPVILIRHTILRSTAVFCDSNQSQPRFLRSIKFSLLT